MIFWLGVLVSLALPVVTLTLSWMVLYWLLLRTTPSAKALQRAEEMGPPPPPVSLVDSEGNVRHEWAVDLLQQRLRRSEHRW